MRIPSLLEHLKFIGQAEGDRRTYYVFQGSSDYVLASSNGGSELNVTVVDTEAPEAVSKSFKGRQVTGRMVEKNRRGDLFSAPFAGLNTLYVMVGLGRAKKLKKRQGKAMVFKIK